MPLEDDLHCKLQDARIIGVGDLTVVSAAQSGGHAAKVRVVCHIERLRAELQIETSGNWESLI